jgi:hypothetical protein
MHILVPLLANGLSICSLGSVRSEASLMVRFAAFQGINVIG